MASITFLIFLFLIFLSFSLGKKLAFEKVTGLLLLCPLIVYYPNLVWGPSILAHWILLLLVLGITWALTSKQETINIVKDNLVYFILWSSSFLIFYSLSLTWADFYPIGERIRDYAVLGSVLRDPVFPEEPWLAGYSLKYYTYWYRVGSFFSTLFRWPTWTTYHALISFGFSLYFVVIVRFLQRFFKFSLFYSIIVAVVVVFGPNLKGFLVSFSGPLNWWLVSRVVPGTINEFPAWAFLLGDLHPHFMNLGLFFTCLLFAKELIEKYQNTLPTAHHGLLLFIFCLLWCANANTWEIPLWVGMLGIYFFLNVLEKGRKERGKWSFSWSGLFLIVAYIVLAWPLGVSLKQLPQSETPLKFIVNNEWRSQILDLFMHFGFPLTALTLVIGLRLKPKILKFMSLGGIVTLTFLLMLFQGPFWPLGLVVILFMALGTYQLYQERKLKDQIWGETLAWGAILLLIFCEFFYFDDPYGVPYERMNTVFKIYNFIWTPLLLTAFYFVRKQLEQLKLPVNSWPKLISLVCLVPWLLFFFRTAIQRGQLSNGIKILYSQEKDKGLETLDKTYPGAKKLIEFMRNLPDGVVLEEGKQAYSFATYTSTLSGHTSYLGWINHINLLTRQYAEAHRRTKIMKQIYTSQNCQERKLLMKNEEIDYLVWGPLEKQKYGQELKYDSTCLKRIFEGLNHSVYALSAEIR